MCVYMYAYTYTGMRIHVYIRIHPVCRAIHTLTPKGYVMDKHNYQGIILDPIPMYPHGSDVVEAGREEARMERAHAMVPYQEPKVIDLDEVETPPTTTRVRTMDAGA